MHLPTLAVGLLSLGVLVAAGRFVPRLPAALVAMLVAGVVVQLFALQATGVGVLGSIPAGLPALSVPAVPLHQMPVLLAEAAGLTLLSFSSTMLAARSFAEKNRYDLDADREVAALGAANVAAALSQSFAVTGSGLRTSVAEAAGARTQMAGLVAAAALVPVLLFFTGPLQYIPSVALAAILISAAVSMLNWKDLRAIHDIEPQEFWLAVVATAGVLVFGAIEAILLVVVLALLRFVRLTARRLPVARAPPRGALAAGPAAVPLQRSDRVLQRPALQARGARGGGGGRSGPALVRDRPAAGEPD
jgi:MFS superfamily sulfate permease-like transporter